MATAVPSAKFRISKETSPENQDDKDSSSNGSNEDSDDEDLTDSKKKAQKGNIKGKSLPNVDLSPAEFRKRGKELIDFIADYMEGSRDRMAMVNVQPGFIFYHLPKTAPKDGCTFESLMSDLRRFILPGVPQWQNPRHHALMPLGMSYASLLGSILADGLGCASLTWNECPASVELEMVVTNWLAELMELPQSFQFFGRVRTGPPSKRWSTLSTAISAANAFGSSMFTHLTLKRPSSLASSSSNSRSRIATAGPVTPINGGGIILNSTVECLLTVMVAAKRVTLNRSQSLKPYKKECEVLELMVAYCSDQAHPGMERVCQIIGVSLKRVWTDSQGVMHLNALKTVLEEDKLSGAIPFFVLGTIGTIASASVDQMDKIGPYIMQNNCKMWYHIDASYAGCAFICREYQPIMHGVSFADSIHISIHKWLPVNMDCDCLWVKRINNLTSTFNCQDPKGPLYIPVDDKNNMADYRNWGIPMMRKFKAIKMWTVFKLYGFKKLQQKIREDVRRAKELERAMHEDSRFQVMTNTLFGIVTFRCKRPDTNEVNKQILQQLNKSRVLKMTGARVGNKFWLRYVVAGRYTSSDDVMSTWEMIKRATLEVTSLPSRFEKPEKEHEGRY